MAASSTPAAFAQAHAGALAIGGAGVALMLLAVAWRLGWLPRVFAAGKLYTRLTKRGVTASPARQMLSRLIEAEPGIDTARLETLTAMNVGTLEYHLRVLEREGLVKSLKLGRTRTWWSTGAASPTAAERALREPARAAIVALVRDRPGLTLGEIARERGLAKATAHQHLRALRDADVISAMREGVRVRHYVTLRPEASLEAQARR